MTDLVNFKNTIALHIKQNKLVDDITNIIKEIKNLEELRLDPELTKYVCNVIQNTITKEEEKQICKKNLCATILISLFNLDEKEVNAVDKQIKYLENNNEIKTVKVSKKFKKSVWAWFKKKILWVPQNFISIYINPIQFPDPVNSLIIYSITKLGLPKLATVLMICFLAV